MDKELFRKTEGKLYRYYETKKALYGMEDKIRRLELQKEVIEYDIRNTNVKVDPYPNGVGLSERVQTSPSGSSYAEQEIIKLIEGLEINRANLMKKILKLRAKKMDMENYISNMDYNINMLNEESKRFLELKYGDKEKVIAIAFKMNIAEATVYRIRTEIVENIAYFMNILK